MGSAELEDQQRAERRKEKRNMSRYSNDPGEYPWPAEYVPQPNAPSVEPAPEEQGTEARCAGSAGSDSFCENDIDQDDTETGQCPRCHGIGGDPMDDYCTPCDHCDGEGYE